VFDGNNTIISLSTTPIPSIYPLIGLNFSPAFLIPQLHRPSLSSSKIFKRIAMSDIPFKTVTAFSAVCSFVIVGYKPELLLFLRPSYIGTFVQFWVLSFVSWCFWKIILFPKFFSPLRYLPQPTGGSWWNGHFGQISALPTGAPMIEW
jgi:hypothetical protein